METVKKIVGCFGRNLPGILAAGIVVAGGAVCYVLGQQRAKESISRGIEVVCYEDPELTPHFKAIEHYLNERSKK